MYGHLGLPRVWVPTSVTGKHERSTTHETSTSPSAIGSGSAVAVATTTVAIGAALLAAPPHTATALLAMVFGFGLMVSALVMPVDRRRS